MCEILIPKENQLRKDIWSRIQLILGTYDIRNCDLAKRLGVERNTVTSWMKRCTVPLVLLYHLYRDYDIDVNYLITGENTKSILKDSASRPVYLKDIKAIVKNFKSRKDGTIKIKEFPKDLKSDISDNLWKEVSGKEIDDDELIESLSLDTKTIYNWKKRYTVPLWLLWYLRMVYGIDLNQIIRDKTAALSSPKLDKSDLDIVEDYLKEMMEIVSKCEQKR